MKFIKFLLIFILQINFLISEKNTILEGVICSKNLSVEYKIFSIAKHMSFLCEIDKPHLKKFASKQLRNKHVLNFLISNIEKLDEGDFEIFYKIYEQLAFTDEQKEKIFRKLQVIFKKNDIYVQIKATKILSKVYKANEMSDLFYYLSGWTGEEFSGHFDPEPSLFLRLAIGEAVVLFGNEILPVIEKTLSKANLSISVKRAFVDIICQISNKKNIDDCIIILTQILNNVEKNELKKLIKIRIKNMQDFKKSKKSDH